jgi:hypothetical protein
MCVFSEGLANTNFVVFDLTPSEIKLTTARRANYTTDVVRDRPFNFILFYFIYDQSIATCNGGNITISSDAVRESSECITDSTRTPSIVENH